MTNREIIIALVSSLVSGFLVWVIQQTYLNRREKKKEQSQLIIKTTKNAEKIFSDDVFNHLGPGHSVELMKEMFGVPNKFSRLEYPVFSEEEVATNSYTYRFKNAWVKVTSKDNESIDTLTVLASDNSLSIEQFFFLDDIKGKLTEVKVWPNLIAGYRHDYIQNRWDSSFAIEYYTGPPLYQHFTFFGENHNNYMKYYETKDPTLFVGSKISGVCISNSEDGFFIHGAELI